MRVVFLADTKQLAQVYDAMAEFTREFLRGSGH
jgi:hypothetical protein